MLTVMRLWRSMSQKQKIVNMKIIITEEQYNNLFFRRRLFDIVNEGLFIIDNGDNYIQEQVRLRV